MSLRQREWVIFMRPYYEYGGNRVDFDGTPKASPSDVGRTGSGCLSLNGDAEGNDRADTGGWVMYHKTRSFKELRKVYKELLTVTAQENLRVAEIVNVDTLVTPIS